jgi:hypothetical protein
MDDCRRRKTVFAGTFAIARKSVSNSRPITLVERDALKRIRKGYTRAAFHSVAAVQARGRAREGRGWGLFSEGSPRTSRGQKTEFGGSAGVAPSRLPSRTISTRFFC